jgi:hypothetical protein
VKDCFQVSHVSNGEPSKVWMIHRINFQKINEKEKLNRFKLQPTTKKKPPKMTDMLFQ